MLRSKEASTLSGNFNVPRKKHKTLLELKLHKIYTIVILGLLLHEGESGVARETLTRMALGKHYVHIKPISNHSILKI